MNTGCAKKHVPSKSDQLLPIYRERKSKLMVSSKPEDFSSVLIIS